MLSQGGITMKKFLSITLIIIYISISYPVSAGISTQANTISKIENSIYGFDYSKDSTQKRVESFE